MPKTKIAPEGETKEQKSERVMTFRMKKAIGRLRQIQTCASSNQYVYTDAQKQNVVETLRKELEAIESSFNHSKTKEGIEFTL